MTPSNPKIEEKPKELCGYGCGRQWDEEGDFNDCPSAYHVIPDLDKPTGKERYETGQSIKHYMNRDNDKTVSAHRENNKCEKIIEEKLVEASKRFMPCWDDDDEVFLRTAFTELLDERTAEVVNIIQNSKYRLRHEECEFGRSEMCETCISAVIVNAALDEVIKKIQHDPRL